MVPTPSTLPARSNVLVVVLSAVTLTALAVVGGWFMRVDEVRRDAEAQEVVRAAAAASDESVDHESAPSQARELSDGGATRERESVRSDVVAGRSLVVLDAPRAARVLRGRFIGIEPPPGPEAQLSVLPASRRDLPRARSSSATIAEGGIFRIEFVSPAIGRFEDFHVRIDMRERDAAYDAEVPLPETMEGTEIDVSNVVASPIPVLVSGRVVDELGQPVPETRVSLVPDERTAAWSSTDSAGSSATGADGRFVLLENYENRDLILYAVPPKGFASTRVPFQRRARDVEVVVATTGAIVGTIDSDRTVFVFARRRGADAVLPEAVSRVTGANDLPGIRGQDVQMDRKFRLEVRPGRFDVFATASHGNLRDDLLASVADVEVRAGEETADRRLSPLVLRGERFKWRVELTRRDGAPAPSSWICLAPEDSPSVYWRTAHAANGTAELEAALDSAWIDVFAVSFKRVHLLRTHGTIAVELEPVEQDDVEFELAVDPAIDGAGLEFRVVADQDPPLPSFVRDSYASTLDVGTPRSIALDRGARWNAHLLVGMVGVNSSGAHARVELPRFTRDVLVATGPTRFDVTAADVAEARAALEKQLTR